MKAERLRSAARDWNRSLGERDRRALRLGVVFLLPALLYALGLRPALQSYAEARVRLDRERGLLARELVLLAEAKRLPTRAAATEAALLREAPRLFAGPDALAASGAMTSYVTDRALAHRVFVQSSETRAADRVGEGVLRLAVELDAAGDLSGVMGWLADLEGGPKLVNVERLTVAPAQSIGGAPPRDDEVLAVALTVHAYTLAEESR